MRCFKACPTKSLSLYRRCSISTSYTTSATAAALRTKTHSTESVCVACLNEPPTRVAYKIWVQASGTLHSGQLSKTWFAYSAIPSSPSAPILAVEQRALRLQRQRAERRATNLLSKAVNGLTPQTQLMDGFLLSKNSHSENDKDPVSERTLNLGKTIDILKSRLPTLLQSPLPSEILSPSITLQLFPSTHPHLPTVRGRMAYIAALWTSPVVWGRIPGIKVRLEILSIKMIKGGIPLEMVDEDNPCVGEEQMIVKWRASSSPNGNAKGNGQNASSSSPTSTLEPSHQREGNPLSSVTPSLPKFATTNGDFCGLFIFEFDEMGRIKTHTIEDVEEDVGESRQQHSKVITLTEWLLKKAKGSLEEKPPMPGLAFEHVWQAGGGGIGRRERFLSG